MHSSINIERLQTVLLKSSVEENSRKSSLKRRDTLESRSAVYLARTYGGYIRKVPHKKDKSYSSLLRVSVLYLKCCRLSTISKRESGVKRREQVSSGNRTIYTSNLVRLSVQHWIRIRENGVYDFRQGDGYESARCSSGTVISSSSF
ncbi:hypothetical protein Trydic_g22050 [Trypoxylus dichotomus]